MISWTAAASFSIRLVLVSPVATTATDWQRDRRDQLAGGQFCVCREQLRKTSAIFYSSGIENEHEVYSIAQLEARTSLTKELARGCDVEHNKQLSLSNEQKSSSSKTLKNNNNSGQQQPKVQKNPKSVRICEPPKQSGPRGAVPCFTSPPGGAVPIQVQIAVPLGSSSCALNAASVNRPRSVTDALFAAAPEVAPANPTAPVAAPAQSSSIQNQHLPQTSAEDMNKGFLPFADEDPDLISEYL